MGNTVHYVESNSVDYWKYILNINGHKLMIYYGYFQGEWQYVIKFMDDTTPLKTQEEVLTYLTNKNII